MARRPRKPTRGGARPGAGRKPVEASARERTVPIRLTQAEYEIVVAAVEAENAQRAWCHGSPAVLLPPPQTVSGWFRDAGLAALPLRLPRTA